MILTGKAKKDFLEYYNNHSIKYLLSWTDFDDLPLVVKNSLIIEWFDSVGIYILPIKRNTKKTLTFSCDIYKNNIEVNRINKWIETRQEATSEAIKKANEIYNNL